ncbi:FAD-dependent oxidoreductase [Martelella mediterranea]|uniref:Thioredoxin reductase n=1 Tax=Martelella mediterranea DSM 17316 TaxID=1122214 RepID=A0A1U9Z3I5_9HYPH|nr:FAD-dependent oxidoreductase [Martelella mediterranea]AQZ52210.1 Thioredoxin reductase [Martelella mediterranea DSM 17316]
MLMTNEELSDPWKREGQTFPELSEDMMNRLSGYGREEQFDSETQLFKRGDRSIDFFVVLAGEIRITYTHAGAGQGLLYTYRRGQFTGEQNLFNTRKILLTATAVPGTVVLRVRNENFRSLLIGEPEIGEIIIRAFILRRMGFIRHQRGGVVLLGHPNNGQLLELQRFLTRNTYPVEVIDSVSSPEAEALMTSFGLTEASLPAVIEPDRSVLIRPNTMALADRLGIAEAPDTGAIYDVAVVGAGPSGLAAAVYAASEGLNTIVLEKLAPGGQAGTSSKIENYLGFPTGISGMALAGRAHIQAQKFGALLSVSRNVVSVDCSDFPLRLTLEDGRVVSARSIVVASGARYRRLDVPDYDRFEGQGIHYAATAMEAQICREQDVVVVGGGNSAGQAAIFLAGTARHVHMLLRSGISRNMSDYLVQRILSAPKISVYENCQVEALHGLDALQEVIWRDAASHRPIHLSTGNMFVMIGAAPNTDWLQGCIDLDQRGFVTTGMTSEPQGPLSPFATSHPGIFAVGDVRSGSVKRVASAVGEGSVVVSAIHQFLASQHH